MKTLITTSISMFIGAAAFSQKDSIWIAKYKSENGVTKYPSSIMLKQTNTNITH